MQQMALEFRTLKETLDKLTRTEAAEWDDEVLEPLRCRMTTLACKIAATQARSCKDVVLKAQVLLDWIDPEQTDMPTMLSAFLCRDVMMLYPSEI